MNNLRIPAIIVIAALAWAFAADPLISFVAVKLAPHHENLFRAVNDFIIVLLVSFGLYRRIIAQQGALQKAADGYRRLFEEIPAPMFIFHATDFRFLAVNQAALEQYGYSREEFLQLKATDIRPAGEVEAFLDVNTRIPANYWDAGRWIHHNKHGEKFHVHIFTHAIKFEGKEAKQTLALNIDQKVLAEQALEKKSGELVDVLESMTDAFYTLDREWRITYINKEYERLQNRKREDMLGKNVWELFPYGKERCYYREYERVVREQTSAHFEEYNPWNGMWVRVNAYPTPNGLAIYFQDITEERQAREKILLDEQNLRAIINNTRDLIWSVDRSRQVITANQAFWDRIAYLTGKTPGSFQNSDFDPQFFKPFLKNYAKAFQGKSFKIQRERQYPDGMHYEEISFNPIVDRQEVVGVACFLRDTTENQQHLEQIKKQNERLREIAWIQSHKVRVPVANLLGLIQLLETTTEDPVTEGIRKSVLQLDGIIRDISRRTEELS